MLRIGFRLAVSLSKKPRIATLRVEALIHAINVDNLLPLIFVPPSEVFVLNSSGSSSRVVGRVADA